MLRAAVLIVACILAVAGGWLCVAGIKSPGLYLLTLGVVIVIGTVFERWRYRKNAPPVDASWEPTGERFSDPQSGASIEVFYDPRSGERQYVGPDGTLHTPPGR